MDGGIVTSAVYIRFISSFFARQSFSCLLFFSQYTPLRCRFRTLRFISVVVVAVVNKCWCVHLPQNIKAFANERRALYRNDFSLTD